MIWLESLFSTISIGVDPDIAKFGGLVLTWHGIFAAIAIALGVYIAVKMGLRRGFTEDDAYTVALIGVPCGIIGARLLYVAENWEQVNTFVNIFKIQEGGISIYGAVIGGVLGGWLYGMWKKMRIGAGLDAAAFGLILGMGIGRIGDVINGEHFATSSSLPWAVEYTNVNSVAFGLSPMHPAVAYEMLGDFLIFGGLFWLTNVYRKDGLLFFTYLFAYSAMRFGLNFMRIDASDVGPIDLMQIISLAVMAVAALGFLYYWRKPARVAPPVPSTAPARTPST